MSAPRKRWQTRTFGTYRVNHDSKLAAYRHVAGLRQDAEAGRLRPDLREVTVYVAEGRLGRWSLYERIELQHGPRETAVSP